MCWIAAQLQRRYSYWMKWWLGIVLFSIQVLAQVPETSLHEATILKRLLGNTPPRALENNDDCSDHGQPILCSLQLALKDKKAAQIILDVAKKYDLYLMLDQSKTRISKKILYDKITYQSYVDFAPDELESIWSLEQLQLIKSVLESLPKELTTFDHTKNIYLIPEGYFITRGRELPDKRPNMVAVTQSPTFLNGALRNEGFMAFMTYPYFRFGDNLETKRTLVHELAHAFDHQAEARHGKMISSREEWWSISWHRDGYEYSPVSKKLFVTDYAMTSPAEDFAESVATFIYDAQKLMAVSPQKYQFIKNLFHIK
jgi:hypothetical protein